MSDQGDKLSQITKHQLYSIARPNHAPFWMWVATENACSKNMIPCFATLSRVIFIKLVFHRTHIYAQKHDSHLHFLIIMKID